MISHKAKGLSSPAHIPNSYHTWKEGEQLFKEITGATDSSRGENINHIDFTLEGKKIDVKGLKRSQQNGYILVEFLNVQGKAGWCSKHSQATHIAFQFPNEFIVVDKELLREKVLELCGQYQDANRQLQAKVHGYPNVAYKYLGRKQREDVFVYIEVKHLYELPHDKIKY